MWFPLTATKGTLSYVMYRKRENLIFMIIVVIMIIMFISICDMYVCMIVWKWWVVCVYVGENKWSGWVRAYSVCVCIYVCVWDVTMHVHMYVSVCVCVCV